MFNISVNDKKNIYRSKPVMNVDTTGSSGGGSIPKPLTYDYMPEGYPKKVIETVTLMEEQEVTFGDTDSGLMEALSPVALDIKRGDKLTVVWDGISYNVVVKELVNPGPGGNMVEIMFGNLALINKGESEDYPFVYCGVSAPINEFYWVTADTAASHTIKVMRQQVTIAPMSTDFIPKNFNVVFSGGINSSIPDSCDVTYDELRGWIGNGIPVFATYKYKQDDGSVSSVKNIINFEINTGSLRVYYGSGANFKYNSDGTFSGSGVES